MDRIATDEEVENGRNQEGKSDKSGGGRKGAGDRKGTGGGGGGGKGGRLGKVRGNLVKGWCQELWGFLGLRPAK